MKVSEHFDSHEFAQHEGHGLPALDYPVEWIETRLTPLCKALEVIRRACGGAQVKILSGYRSPAYNAAIGGAAKSQHMEGRAADIEVVGVAPERVHALCLDLYHRGDLLIGGLGKYPSFTHVDVRGGALVTWQG